MITIKGRVTSVTRRDDRTGQTLARLGPLGENPQRISYLFRATLARTVGHGEIITLQGAWTQDSTLGRVFDVKQLTREPPSTREGEVYFLAGYIKGLSKVTARMLLESTNGLAGLIELCKKRPAELDELLPKARVIRQRLRAAQWDKRDMDFDIFVSLQSAGLRMGQIQDLTRFFGAHGLRQIAQQSPYDFCQVPRVGFVSAERVARFYAEAQGRPIDALNMNRLMYGLAEAVGRERSGGHMGVPAATLMARAHRLLEVPYTPAGEEALRHALEQSLTRRLLIQEHGLVYARGLQRVESETAMLVSRLMTGGAKPLGAPEAVLRGLLKDSKLSDEQTTAVITCARQPMSLLLGGPGRGKTHTLRSLTGLLKKYKRTYLLLAPTGKAAKRAAEMTGDACLTIHKACGLESEADIHSPKAARKLGAREKFSVDVVIVDESSMVDAPLAYELLRRIKVGRTALIWVGDPDQLSPVGPGQVLKDLIASERVPIARLTKIFRQANGSPIVDAADAINIHGQAPAFPTTGYEARLFDPTTARDHPGDDPEAASAFEIELIRKWLVAAMRRYVQDLGLNVLRDIQVYAPQKNGPLGLFALNGALQAAFNPLPRGATTVRIDQGFVAQVGDKVMQIVNNYRLRLTTAGTDTVGEQAVMNGQVGFIELVEPEGRGVWVRYDDVPEAVVYRKSEEWRQLSPAYAMSIHRAQGSETPYAFIVIHDSMNPRLVNRPLLYTGVTRAKQGFAVFGSAAAVARAAANLDGTVRHTALPQRLRETVRSGVKRPLMMPTAVTSGTT